MFGKPRSQKSTRLYQEAKKGDSIIFVETGLYLIEGDRIALAPTSYAFGASDQSQVKSYNQSTGTLELETPLKHYHWGRP